MDKVLRSEQTYENRKCVKTAVALSLRYWQSFRVLAINGDAPAVPVLLKKAFHVASSMAQRNQYNTELQLCRIFLSIEMGDYEYADELLDTVSPYKNYYKSSEPVYYAIFLFLLSLLELRRKKARPANKHYNQLSEYSSDKSDSVYPLLLGLLSLEMCQYRRCWALLSESWSRGLRSGFLFLSLYGYYMQVPESESERELLFPLISWLIAQGGDIRYIIEIYGEGISVFMSSRIGERIHAAYNSDGLPPGSREWILKEICRDLLNNQDYSLQAYHYYKEAELKQLYVPGLNGTLIKSAYRNNIEVISRFSMEEFLRSGDMDTDMGLKAYVYHLLLTNKKLKDFSEVYSNEIMQFCVYCIENRINGRYYNSIYKYFLDVCRERGMAGGYMQDAEDFISADLFTYMIEAESSDVRFVYIKEKEKREMDLYELDGGMTRIKASWENFSYICLSADKRRIIDEELKITGLVENADIALYMYLYNKGVRSYELLTALSRHCFSLEKPGTECVGILDALLSYKQLSISYRMMAKAFIGNMYYTSGDYETALSYYRGVDENCLGDKHIEQMLVVFIDTGELDVANRLIEKKSQCISDRTLFYALKKLAQEPEYHAAIADTAYELLLKSWYDKALLDIVINNYKGGQEEWQELSKILAGISVSEEALDGLILANSIRMHKFDKGSQMVFIRMFSNMSENRIVERFAYYCVYEMIVNKVKPTHDTIVALEKMYHNNKDRFLCYALSSVYLEHELITLNSESIIEDGMRFQEEEQIIFPFFKDNIDKRRMTPYIEKIQPFIYRGLPDKNVWLYYKTEEDEPYSAKKMRYIRFGMYMTTLINFYGETITYYFYEEMPTGSIVTLENKVENNRISFNEERDEPYFTINNALIYEQMFKYDQVEEIITDMVRETRRIQAKIL